MKKIGLIGMVLVLCLALVGVGYATWQKTLDITGTVSTGNIDWVVSEYCDTIDGDDKDVSTLVCTVVGDQLTVTIGNAYPCVTYTNIFAIHHVGSVPVHVYLQNVDAGPSWLGGSIVLKAGVLSDPGDPNSAIVPGPVVTDEYIQLHECQWVFIVVTVHIAQTFDHDGDPATPDITTENQQGVGMSADIVSVQYNKLPV